MGKLKKVIKNYFGKEIVVNPMVDQYKYCTESRDYAGGSLQCKNILIITSKNRINTVQSIIRRTNLKASFLVFDNIISEDYSSITSVNSDNLGPFTNIVNILEDEDNVKSTDEMIKTAYKLLQIESDYLIRKSNHGIISSAFITNDLVLTATIESLIKGLSLALGKHGVIENGLIADKTVQLHDILNSLSYLNSKYGYILAGEVLILSEDKRNE